MIIINSKLVKLKIGDGASPIENFTDIGGMQINRLNIDNEAIRTNNITSDIWQNLTPSIKKNISIDGEGVFTNSSSEDLLLNKIMNDAEASFQLHFSSSHIISGKFFIKKYEQIADNKTIVRYRLSMQNSGAICIQEINFSILIQLN